MHISKFCKCSSVKFFIFITVQLKQFQLLNVKHCYIPSKVHSLWNEKKPYVTINSKLYPSTLSASKPEKGVSVITAQRYPFFPRCVSNVYEKGENNFWPILINRIRKLVFIMQVFFSVNVNLIGDDLYIIFKKICKHKPGLLTTISDETDAKLSPAIHV